MKNFRKISELVTSDKVKINVEPGIFQGSGQETKMQKLISGILSGAYANDEEAAWDLYRTKPSDKNYLMLKSRIKDQIVNHIFRVEAAKNFRTVYERALYQCNKNIAAARILLLLVIRKEAVELLKPALSQSRQFHFTELALIAARMLRTNAAFEGSKKEVEHYNKLLLELQQTLQAELRSDELRDMMNVQVRSSFSLINKEWIKDYWIEANQLALDHPTHNILINMYRIGVKYYESLSDFNSIINLCDEGEDYLNGHPHLQQPVRFAEFALYKMDACLSLRDYERGNQNATTCMKYYTRGGINWLVFNEYYFLLCLHTGNYGQAYHVYESIISHPKFETYSPDRKEKWKLFEAFLSLVHKPGEKEFRLARFLNEVPVYSKDKRGYNLSIIIAQLLILLDKGDFEKLLDKYESFKNYFTRYVNRHANYRSYYFAQMIMVMFRYNFDAEKTKTIAAKFLKNLQTKNPHYTGDLESLEVIPYEQLWKIVLTLLEKYRYEFEKIKP